VALECAMDELAYKTGVDPVELRLRNDTMTDPYTGRPFSTRAVRECLLQGAEKFGWARRNPKPRSMCENGWLIGQGVAAAVYTHWRWPGTARAVMRRDGIAVSVGAPFARHGKRMLVPLRRSSPRNLFFPGNREIFQENREATEQERAITESD
jgi:CO/xanthine dehydrogenase Mo-binding subunit